MRRLLSLALLGLALFAPARARGEVFLLSNGGRVEGTLLNRDESPRKTYVVQTPLGGQLTLTKSQVTRQIDLKEVDKQYEEQARKSPDSIEGHLAMAEWCRVNSLLDKRKFHLEKIVEREPEHAAARAALGFTKIDGRWLSSDEHMKSQGFVRYQGRWRLRQDVEAEIAADKLKKDAAAWKSKIRVLRVRYEKKGDGGALAEMRGIDDPVASFALADLLGTEELREFRLLYIDVLGRLPSPKGIAALIRFSLHDDDETIRDACLDALAKNGTQQAVKAFIATLDDKDNVLINRAGAGLGRLAQDDAVPALIDALVTQHKQVIGGGGGGGLGTLTPSFNSGGGGGLSAGGKPQVKIYEIPNESVLGALRAITKEDFRFDKVAWRAWWADSRTPKNVNLRRRDE
jgi:hypothetical protein